MFSRALIQAVCDWQRGGYPNAKARRGAALKAEAAKLPTRYRLCDTACYRQVGLTEETLTRLGFSWELPETISAWTKSEEVARGFKNGVPPPGDYTGVIFRITPPAGSVILDLTALFGDPAFIAAVEQNTPFITGYADGIGRYQNTQKEVVIELPKIDASCLCAWGGHSAAEYALAKEFFGRDPSPQDIEAFRQLANNAGVKPGPYWLSTPDAVDRITERLKHLAHAKVQRALAFKRSKLGQSTR